MPYRAALLFWHFLKIGSVLYGSGYVLGGFPGGLLATLGIFLPSFVLVAASLPLLARMRKSANLSAMLRGVNLASLALMAGVAWQMGRASAVGAAMVARWVV